ncbi:MAG: Crp/Fnr family transcriptional regulator [Sedimentisphaeraceae bacterium JB056]
MILAYIADDCLDLSQAWIKKGSFMEKDAKNIEFQLKNCDIFSQLAPQEIAEIAKAASFRDFDGKELIFNAGDKADGFYLIISGRVEIFRSSENGRRQVLHVLGEGQSLGEVPLFEGACYPAAAAAMEKTQTIYIRGSEFLDIAFEKPEILLEMLAVLSKRLRKFVNLIDALSLKDVSERLIGYLKENADADGTTTLDCSKAELAGRLGTIPETLSRALNKLKSDGTIEIEQNTITLQTLVC